MHLNRSSCQLAVGEDCRQRARAALAMSPGACHSWCTYEAELRIIRSRSRNVKYLFIVDWLLSYNGFGRRSEHQGMHGTPDIDSATRA